MFSALSALVESLLQASEAASTAIAFPGPVSATALGTALTAVAALSTAVEEAANEAEQSATSVSVSSTSSMLLYLM